MPEVLDTHISEVEPRQQGGSASSAETGSLNNFHFKLPVFEGPLDLLLHLIKENKVDIYDIPIAEITRQYISYLELMKYLNLEIAGEFLVMAATLIHIKSRMLLPPDEEKKQETDEDPRSELVLRLLEYQAYRESSGFLRERESAWKHVFRRGAPDHKSIEIEPEPQLFEADVFALMTAFRKLLEKAPAQIIEITRETLTVSDRINFIMERIEKEDGVRFEALFEEGSSRVTLIVTFLALLELVRLGLIKTYQEKAFGVIWIINPQKQPGPAPDEAGQEALS
ncbi:MAG: segregation/condensation protein A [Nitrospiraceae bacterium]|nr:MAG: segregation/condensation protein A [Nitrospiraceae bacterium]